MIKKLLFCLLVLTGAGMLNSCQQDEVVNEAPESKEILIRASLPSDEHSRVSFNDKNNGKKSLSWDLGDVITATNGNDSYQFVLSQIDENTAIFKYIEEDSKPALASGNFTFTYGVAPVIGEEQTGTIDGLKHHMTTGQVEITDWNAVNVQFSTTVALIEIPLGENVIASSVSIYDGDKTLATATGSLTETVYFSLENGSYSNLKFKVITSDNNNTEHNKIIGNITLLPNKWYRVNGIVQGMLYSVKNNTLYVYGSGEIPASHFEANGSPTKDLSFDNVIILDGITKIGDAAFHQRPITSVTIPATVTSIGNYAFQQSILTSVTIPGTVQSIGIGAFKECDYLKTVTIANGNLSSIGSEAFKECDYLETVTIANGNLSSIGSEAFKGCDYLKIVTIANGNLSSIGSEAFYGCGCLKVIDIPANVTTIGNKAFYNCKSDLILKFWSTTPPTTFYNDSFGTNLSATYTISVPAVDGVKDRYVNYFTNKGYTNLSYSTFN